MGYEIGRGGLSAEWIKQNTGGKLISMKDGVVSEINTVDAEAQIIRGLSGNSRTLTPGEIFIAIHGEQLDGHDYILGAFESGAYAALCDRIPDKIKNGRFILTEDTTNAFLRLAMAYKDSFSGLKYSVAVTGSVGKTTTKQLIHSVLSQKYVTLKTEGNYNNLVGVPLTMLRLNDSFEAAVFEMGMNSRNEISRMSRAVKPDIGVITSIGTAHIGMLGSRENIRNAKLEIRDGFKTGSILIYNGDEPLLEGIDGETVSFSRGDAACLISDIDEYSGGSEFDLIIHGKRIRRLRIPVIGRHNVFNAAIASLACAVLGTDEDQIRCGLAKFENVGARQRIYKKNGVTVIEDCYNASPESMKAALGVMNSVYSGSPANTGRRIAVLGNMLELGEQSASLHDGLGEFAAEDADILFTLGDDAERIAESARKFGLSDCRCYKFNEDGKAALSRDLISEFRDGDIVLFKASHFIGLEQMAREIFGNSDNE